jgi:hypothetical protein
MFNVHMSTYYTLTFKFTFKFTVFTSRNRSDILSKQLAKLQMLAIQRKVYQSLKVIVRIVQMIMIMEK